MKLAQEIGGHKAASELGIPDVHTPNNVLSLNEELIELRKRVKEQDKEISRLKEENEFLEEASAFFAASRQKSAKNRN